MKRNILIALSNENWPEVDFALYIYDPEGHGKIAPKIQRVSLYDTALANFEVHALNAMRDAASDLVRDGKEFYASPSAQIGKTWQERSQGNGRVWQGDAPQRQQKRPQGEVQKAGIGRGFQRTAKSKAKKKKVRRQ